MRKLGIYILAVFLSLTFGSWQAQAEVKKYGVAVFGDYAGPYANIMKFVDPARLAVFKWWNDTKGKELGVELVPKLYDSRYDSTVVASIWPKILSEIDPILMLGIGGPDASALQQRLPKDKVAGIYPSTGHGWEWLADQWTFYLRSTWSHETMACLRWYISQHPEKKPVKMAIMCTEATPAFIDYVEGMKKYLKEVLEPKGLAKLVALEWFDLQPVDVSSQMKKVIDAKAEIIAGPGTAAQCAAVSQAQKLYGVNIPTITNPHQCIWPLSMAMKSFEAWEGHYTVSGEASCTEVGTMAENFSKILGEKYGLQGGFNPLTIIAMGQGIFAVRAIEHTARKVGGSNLSGEAVRNILQNGKFTSEELMGLVSDIEFTDEAPFPVRHYKVKIETVKNGKYQLATPEWVEGPSDLPKW